MNILLADKIPADKISLGIPLYSGYWTTAPNAVETDGSYKKPSFILKRVTVDYATLSSILASVKKPLLWDEEAQVHYLIMNQYGRNGFLYVENAQAFQAKLDLVNRYHLRGFSAWKIPLEDPGIWEIIKKPT